MEQNEPTALEVLRLNKYIAHCGVCTRKEAVELIRKGFVSVNGTVELNPFHELVPADVITFKGKAIEPKKKYAYALLNKPHKVPFQATTSDTEGITVQKLLLRHGNNPFLPAVPTRNETSGLVVMTNDDALIERLSDPQHRIKSVYQVVLDKPFLEKDLEDLRQMPGQEKKEKCIVGIDYPDQTDQTVVGVELACGTDEWLGSVFLEKGYVVKRLDRTFYGGLTKKDLKRGWSRLLTENEVVFLRYFH